MRFPHEAGGRKLLLASDTSLFDSSTSATSNMGKNGKHKYRSITGYGHTSRIRTYGTVKNASARHSGRRNCRATPLNTIAEIPAVNSQVRRSKAPARNGPGELTICRQFSR